MASSSEATGNDSSPTPARHCRVSALYTMRQVREVSTRDLSNHHQRSRVMVRSAVKYSGTPRWAASRNWSFSPNSMSASISSLPSRTIGRTCVTLGSAPWAAPPGTSESKADASNNPRNTREIMDIRHRDYVMPLFLAIQDCLANKA